MDLREFCKKYINEKIKIINNHSISKITDNSKEVVKNAVFVELTNIILGSKLYFWFFS